MNIKTLTKKAVGKVIGEMTRRRATSLDIIKTAAPTSAATNLAA